MSYEQAVGGNCYLMTFRGRQAPPKPDTKRVGHVWLPRQIPSFLTMKQAGGARGVSRRILCMVKKNGLISENKTAIKNATNILSSSAAKLSKSISTNYIEAINLATSKSLNR
jgi:hypothetical protein